MQSMRRWAAAAALAPAALAFLGGCARRSPRALTIVQSNDITTLDPNREFEVVNDIVAMNVFDPLLRFDRHMTLQPSLAVRWENPNDRTWRLHLRSGVRFHDGTPLTGEDVVYTIRRVLSHPDSELYPFFAGVVRRIDSPEPDIVEIETEHPTPLLSRLAFVYILPARLLERVGDAEFFRRPVGTGPYRFVAWKPGDRVEVAAWDGYWGGRPAVASALFRTVEAPEQRWVVAAREAPVIVLEGPRQKWDEHRKDRSLVLIARPSLSVSYIGLNVAPRPGNPLADARVRRALRLAIDQKELLRRGADNHGFPATQYVPPDVVGYNPAIPPPEYDPAQARRLLAEAGYPGGIDLPLDVEAPVATGFVRELGDELGRASIRAAPHSFSKEEFLRRIDDGRSIAHLAGWVCTSGESSELFETSLHTRGPAGGLGRDNGTGYSNPALDRVIDQLVATIDPGGRVELEKRAMAIAVGDLPFIPLYVQEDRYVLTPDVAWEPRPDGEIFLPEVRLR